MDTRKRIRSEKELQRQWAALGGARLQTEDLGLVTVRYPGHAREAAGPDFKDAVLETQAGGVVRGDVEVHLRSSDWNAHGHSRDPAYEDVILHVVDAAGSGLRARVQSGRAVPLAVLAGAEGGGMPCACAGRARTGACLAVLRSCGYERLRERSSRIAEEIRNNDAPGALGARVGRVLGYSGNAAPMEMLARHVCASPLREKLCEIPPGQRAAQVLHAAGLLPPGRACSLAGMPVDVGSSAAEAPVVPARAWQLHGVYPNNHPVRRAVALAEMLPSLRAISSELARNADLETALSENYFVVKGWGYWRTHYDFGRSTPDSDLVGRAKARAILIDGVMPWLFALSIVTADATLRDSVLSWYGSCPGPAPNSILRHMTTQLSLERRRMTALTAQGLLHLFHQYCTQGLCAVCPLAVGEALSAAM